MPVYVDNFGHTITITVQEDGTNITSGADTKNIVVEKPDKTTVSLTATESSGVFTATAVTGTFATAGKYRAWVSLQDNALTFDYTSDAIEWTVEALP